MLYVNDCDVVLFVTMLFHCSLGFIFSSILSFWKNEGPRPFFVRPKNIKRRGDGMKRKLLEMIQVIFCLFLLKQKQAPKPLLGAKTELLQRADATT